MKGGKIMVNCIVQVDDVFCGEDKRVIDASNYLSSLCEDNVRTGKFFLCYCKS